MRRILVAAILSASLLAPASNALAAGTSCGAFTQSAYGASRTASQEGVTYLAGVQAHVTARQDDLCTSITSNKNQSTQWVMLSGSGTTDGLAQNGVFKSPSSKKFFYDALEYTSSPSGLVLIPNSGTGSLPWGRPTNGTDYTYKTSWEDGGDNKIHFIFCSSATNCVDYAHTSWNPASAGWIGADAVWSEETHYTPSDIAGTLSSKATFLTLMLRKHASGGGSAWYDVSSVSKCDSSGTGRCGSGSYWRYFTDMLNSSTAFADWTCPIDPSQPAC